MSKTIKQVRRDLEEVLGEEEIKLNNLKSELKSIESKKTSMVSMMESSLLVSCKAEKDSIIDIILRSDFNTIVSTLKNYNTTNNVVSDAVKDLYNIVQNNYNNIISTETHISDALTIISSYTKEKAYHNNIIIEKDFENIIKGYESNIIELEANIAKIKGGSLDFDYLFALSTMREDEYNIIRLYTLFMKNNIKKYTFIQRVKLYFSSWFYPNDSETIKAFYSLNKDIIDTVEGLDDKGVDFVLDSYYFTEYTNLIFKLSKTQTALDNTSKEYNKIVGFITTNDKNTKDISTKKAQYEINLKAYTNDISSTNIHKDFLSALDTKIKSKALQQPAVIELSDSINKIKTNISVIEDNIYKLEKSIKNIKNKESKYEHRTVSNTFDTS